MCKTYEALPNWHIVNLSDVWFHGFSWRLNDRQEALTGLSGFHIFDRLKGGHRLPQDLTLPFTPVFLSSGDTFLDGYGFMFLPWWCGVEKDWERVGKLAQRLINLFQIRGRGLPWHLPGSLIKGSNIHITKEMYLWTQENDGKTLRWHLRKLRTLFMGNMQSSYHLLLIVCLQFYQPLKG